MILSEHGMSWPLGGFCQNNGQSIVKNNISSGNWGKSYQRGEQWVITGSGNLPLPVLIINFFLPVVVWSEIFNPEHLSLWCFYQICWTCFPSQPSFHYYPRVEHFSGSLAILSGFLADSPPSLSRLYPSLLPLAGFRAWVCWRDEVVSLPSQPPFAVSIRKNVEELLSFNSSGISLISVQKDCEGSLSWSVFVPKIHGDQAVCLFDLKEILFTLGTLQSWFRTYCPRQTPSLSSEWGFCCVLSVCCQKQEFLRVFPPQTSQK